MFALLCGSRYIATIDGAVHKRHLLAISEGTVVDGVRCIPDAVELLPQQPDKSRARLRIVVIFIFYGRQISSMPYTSSPFKQTLLLLMPSVLTNSYNKG